MYKECLCKWFGKISLKIDLNSKSNCKLNEQSEVPSGPSWSFQKRQAYTCIRALWKVLLFMQAPLTADAKKTLYEKHSLIVLSTFFISGTIYFWKWKAINWEDTNLILRLLYRVYYLNLDQTLLCKCWLPFGMLESASIIFHLTNSAFLWSNGATNFVLLWTLISRGSDEIYSTALGPLHRVQLNWSFPGSGFNRIGFVWYDFLVRLKAGSY